MSFYKTCIFLTATFIYRVYQVIGVAKQFWEGRNMPYVNLSLIYTFVTYTKHSYLDTGYIGHP